MCVCFHLLWLQQEAHGGCSAFQRHSERPWTPADPAKTLQAQGETGQQRQQQPYFICWHASYSEHRLLFHPSLLLSQHPTAWRLGHMEAEENNVETKGNTYSLVKAVWHMNVFKPAIPLTMRITPYSLNESQTNFWRLSLYLIQRIKTKMLNYSCLCCILWCDVAVTVTLNPLILWNALDKEVIFKELISREASFCCLFQCFVHTCFMLP